MRRIFPQWDVYFHCNHLYNWGIGISFYQEFNHTPLSVMARVCQIDLIFFNITITRWEKQQWI